MTLDFSDYLLLGMLALSLFSYAATQFAGYLHEQKRERAAGFFEACVRQANIISDALKGVPPGTDRAAVKQRLLMAAVDNLKLPALRGDTVKALGYQDTGIKATIEGELAKAQNEAAAQSKAASAVAQMIAASVQPPVIVSHAGPVPAPDAPADPDLLMLGAVPTPYPPAAPVPVAAVGDPIPSYQG